MKFSYKELQDLSTVEGGRFRTSTLDDAFNFCYSFAKSHYENFPVASHLIKKEKRKHIVAVYTFARIADDIADENLDAPADERNKLLQEFKNNYKQEHSTNPVFLALNKTIEEFSLPYEPFDKLLVAFERDIYFKQARGIDDLYDYCTYSANPVGELVLRIYNSYNDATAPLSDSICTALQLTNFWQDISRDIEKNRIFIPLNFLEKYNLKNEDVLNRKKTKEFADCISELILITKDEFKKGQQLPGTIKDLGLKYELKITINGGYRVLEKCNELQENLLDKRPELNKSDIFTILVKSILGKKIK